MKMYTNDDHLTAHIKSTFPDLYVDEYFKFYAEYVYKVDHGSVHEVGTTPDRRVTTLYDSTLSEINRDVGSI